MGEIWVDIVTGTYGYMNDLRIITLTPEMLDNLDAGRYTDSEICELGENGSVIIEWA